MGETGERRPGRTMVDTTFQTESSQHCSTMTFKCGEPMMDKCDGKTQGNFECMCGEGYMKYEVEMEMDYPDREEMEREREDRRRTAIMGEVMYCREDSCLA